MEVTVVPGRMPVPDTGSPTKIPAALPIGVTNATVLPAVEVVASCEVATGVEKVAKAEPLADLVRELTVPAAPLSYLKTLPATRARTY